MSVALHDRTTVNESTDALREHLRQGYAAYTYAYPHKSAYRPFGVPMPLAQLWQAEQRQDLFLYLHIPFCHYRCGFCNLFTLGAPGQSLVDAYIEGLERQIRVTAAAIGPHRITRMAIGGGTPSFLSVAQFDTLLATLHRHFHLEAPHRSFAIEVAPDSASSERLRSYRDAGVTRISMGMQSVVDAELDALARPRLHGAAIEAIANIRELDFASLNVDLIYGIEGQTESSFLASLDTILAQAPDELYLYPLYVRQLTGLAKANTRQQLTNFHVTLQRKAPSYDKKIPGNWFEAFQYLIDYLESIREERKKVIFLDELPWLATPRSDFMMALEHFWNSWATNRKDIILIACGSAASWMISELINNRAGCTTGSRNASRSTPLTWPKRSACSRKFTISSGPMMPVGNPG